MSRIYEFGFEQQYSGALKKLFDTREKKKKKSFEEKRQRGSFQSVALDKITGRVLNKYKPLCK